MDRAGDGVAVAAPEGSWAEIDKVPWSELVTRHGVPFDRRVLDKELKRVRQIRRSELLRTLPRRPKRTGEVVSDVYEREYESSNEEFVAGRDKRRDTFSVDGVPVRVDGWFTFAYRLELLDRALERCGGQTVLEVGAGRGTLLALLALRQPEREFVGLELTAAGVARGEELTEDLPEELVRLSGVEAPPKDRDSALPHVSFVQGDATALPFEDDSFDVSFTCLALEQMPHLASTALREMARVTRRYCVFMEPFAEANGLLGMAQLRALDYFRGRYKRLRAFGLEPVYFTKAMPQKLRFDKGLVVARVR